MTRPRTSGSSNFTVLPEIAVAKIRTDAPFQTSCYIGCGVTTGVGAGAGIGAAGAETTETLSPAGPAGAGDASESLEIGGAGTPFCAASTVRLKGVSETVVRPSDTLITMSE